MATVITPPNLFAIFVKGPTGEKLAEPATSEAAADAYCRRYNRIMKAVGEPLRAFSRPVVSVTIAASEAVSP